MIIDQNIASNGDFSSDAEWTISGEHWVIGNGRANFYFMDGNSWLTQFLPGIIPIDTSRRFKVSFTIVNNGDTPALLPGAALNARLDTSSDFSTPTKTVVNFTNLVENQRYSYISDELNTDFYVIFSPNVDVGFAIDDVMVQMVIEQQPALVTAMNRAYQGISAPQYVHALTGGQHVNDIEDAIATGAVSDTGTGYVVGDLLTIDGGDTVVRVTSVNGGGGITGIVFGGKTGGYTTGEKDLTGGTGTGATFIVATLEDIPVYQYELFKKSNAYSFNLIRLKPQFVGRPFSIVEIRIPIGVALQGDFDSKLIPVLYFDEDDETPVFGTEITFENYGSSRMIVLKPDNFSGQNLKGNNSFTLELRLSKNGDGVNLLPVEVPITITVEDQPTP